jgi:flagellar hook assembly protein FlgD
VEEDDPVEKPTGFALHQNYPNPFNPTTTISYDLPVGKDNYFVSLKIYDALGRLIKVLVSENQTPGLHRITWDGTDMNGRTASSGIYFYTIQIGDFRQTQKMVLMR